MNNNQAFTFPSPAVPQYLIIAALIFAALVGLRFLNLNADPPTWFIPTDHGLQVDEGYKTLHPRNLALYGTTHWNEHDGYPGWFGGSPLTQWPYYLAFKTFGTSVETARAVVVTGYALFLVISCWFIAKRNGTAIALIGMVILGSSPALFHFSRSAIFEAPVIIVFYICLMLWFHFKPEQSTISTVLGATIAGGITASFVKASALLYIVPAICIVLLAGLLHQKHLRRGLLVALPIALIILGGISWTVRDLWLARLDIPTLLHFWQHFLLNPIPELSPMLLSGAVLTILYALRTNIAWILANPYRLLLVGIILGAPLLLSIFRYQPPRFFVPIIPACVLLIVEALRSPPQPASAPNPFNRPVRITLELLLLCSLAMFGMRDLNSAVLEYIPVNIGDDPGISGPALLKLLPLAAPALITVYYIWGQHLTGKRFQALLITALLLSLIPGTAHLARTILHPEYKIEAISEKLETVVAPDESVGGVIAPLFTMNTRVQSLYIESRWLNQVETFPELRPTYLLLGSFRSDRDTLAALSERRDIAVSDPVELGSYFLGPMYLYRLTYLSPAER